MFRKEILIVKRDMANDSKPVSNNAKFKDITKMSVDIKLFDFWICRSMRRHRAISGFIRVMRFIKVVCLIKILKKFDFTCHTDGKGLSNYIYG